MIEIKMYDVGDNPPLSKPRLVFTQLIPNGCFAHPGVFIREKQAPVPRAGPDPTAVCSSDDPDGLKEPGRQCHCDEWGSELAKRIDVLTTGVGAACKQADTEVAGLRKEMEAVWRCLREDARDRFQLRFQLGKRLDLLERIRHD